MVYRRVRKSEQDQLEQLCLKDLQWIKYYDQVHSIWVSQALQNIRSSDDRVVLGAFLTQDENGISIKNKLIACIFLKRSKFENTIELKNLICSIIDTQCKYEDIAGRIIEKAIRFCEIRGIEKIEIELPQAEHGLISIFLKHDFRIVAVRDRYNSTPVCLLSKTIGNTYYGDPFENEEIAVWLLKQYLPNKNLRFDYEKDILNVRFEARTPSNVFSEQTNLGKSKMLKGILWVLEISESDNMDGDITYISNHSKDYKLRICIAEELSDSQKRRLEKNNFVTFTRAEIIKLAGDRQSSLSIPMRIDEVGGVITVLDVEEIVKILTRETTTYYLLSEVNAGLQIYSETKPLSNESEETLPLLVVFCPNWKSNSAGIIGYFNISKIDKRTFESILSEGTPDDSALTWEDLNLYKMYSEKQQIAEVFCGQLNLFEEPLLLSNLEWISSESIEEYLNREIFVNGNNSAYLDVTSSRNLKKIPTIQLERNVLNLKNNSMFLESIISAVSFLANAATIAGYTQDQIDRLETNLKKADPEASMALANDSRLKALVEIQTNALDRLIKKYQSAAANPRYNEAVKDEVSNQIAEQALAILSTLSMVSEQIPDYDQLVDYFNAIK